MRKSNDEYLSISEAVKLIKPDRRNIAYIISKGVFSSQIMVSKNLTLIPRRLLKQIEDYYEENKALFEKYNESDEHINALLMSRYLGITFGELMNQIQDGKWEGKYVSIPKITPPVKKDQNHFNYFFIRSLTVGNYKTINEICTKNIDIIVTRETVFRYARQGWLPQPDHLKGTNLYDEKEVLAALPKIRGNQILADKNKIKESIVSRYSLLNNNQKKAIDKFLNFRKNNGIIDFNGFRSKDNIAHIDKTLKNMKEIISSAFVLIISGRCGLDEEVIVNKRINKDLIDRFDPDVFDFLSITVDDYFYLSSKRKKATLKNYLLNLKQFYYYYLQQLELEAVISEEKHREFLALNLRVKQFLNQFPREGEKWFTLDESKTKKSFLTPEQMIKVKDLILSDPIARNPIKNAAIWQLGCTTGLRPEEMVLVRIEHFLLDEKGLLKLNDRGWGVLRLPVEASKHENSPSHVVFGTPIPKDTVALINQYLQKLYSKQGSANKQGYGYLFRPNTGFPDIPYNIIVKEFINRIRPLLEFLSIEQRENFLLKSSRHSMNNLISKTYLPIPRLNGEIQKIAAQYQMRHKPKDSTTGDDYYSALIGEDDFYKVLDLTINFPWNHEQLDLWEIKQGHKKPKNNESVPEAPTLEEQSKEKSNRVNQIENRLVELKTRPKTMSVKEWAIEVNKLKREQSALLTI
ncbi:site-specific integrase [Ornithinibacillus californiensis]|uniref:site-specific integrase n=1 Tax=Ornithinibacillus californiensis TaxID=161536 RepID=UPI00064DE0CE|nr:site-specific integrase [Ornithinibacillus californiensis]